MKAVNDISWWNIRRNTVSISVGAMMRRKQDMFAKENTVVVPGAGIEPARLAAGDFESPASTNFTTRAIANKT
jgi:hypothetical protein